MWVLGRTAWWLAISIWSFGGATVDDDEPQNCDINVVLEVNERYSVFHLPFAKLTLAVRSSIGMTKNKIENYYFVILYNYISSLSKLNALYAL